MADQPVSTLDFLNRARAYLERHEADSPRLDAEVLLAQVLDCTRLDLYVRYDRPLCTEEVECYRTLIQDRGRGVPVAYLTGRREFYSLDFAVSPRVLIPRPETEHLVEAALGVLAPDQEALVMDVGTGSGCVGIAVARNRPRIEVIATDVSGEALETAAHNARRLHVEERFFPVQADILEAFQLADRGRSIQVLLSNPPYIPADDMESLPRDVRDHEPRSALCPGETGTEFHEALLAGAVRVLGPGGALYMEVGLGQEGRVAAAVQEALGNVEILKDLAGISRIVGGKRV